MQKICKIMYDSQPELTIEKIKLAPKTNKRWPTCMFKDEINDIIKYIYIIILKHF